MDSIRCNICDETITIDAVAQHVEGRGHAIKKRVAEFQEMNAQLSKKYPEDTSIVKSWIKNLYSNDFLSGIVAGD